MPCSSACFAALPHGESIKQINAGEYDILGGMKNEMYAMTLNEYGLVISDHEPEILYLPPVIHCWICRLTLRGMHLESWADLPWAEEQPLDAPSKYLRVVYADGSAFSISREWIHLVMAAWCGLSIAF